MINEGIKIYNHASNKISMKVLPGHFATSHSHINYFFDMTNLKIRQSEAREVARAISQQYSYNTVVDTVVCMDGTEVIGAYLADELQSAGIMSLNSHKTIYVVSPETDNANQIIFRDNTKIAIENKHVLLLLASATTGRTVMSALDCIRYYGGRIAGISALFSAVENVSEYQIHAIFNGTDLPQYNTYAAHDCPMCKEGRAIDALVNSYGYSVL
ncbi:MAG: orotate phosphoribosyltransferase [Lachnospiraceae bacterium]|nr:orotate phosphoribosyltransferase [Lachnospiraceae bacterium]